MMRPSEKQVLVADEDGSGVIRARDLLFVAGCDGNRDLDSNSTEPSLAGRAEAQCENSYGKVARYLERAGAGYANVVRLDHYTSSQDWLDRRQTVRGRLFGQPAPLASTGVASRMAGINMITTIAIAVDDPANKAVLVPGPKYGMNNISSAVRAGGLVFLSGVRGIRNRITGEAQPEERPDALAAQVRTCCAVIERILADCGMNSSCIVRLDSYIRDLTRAEEERRARQAILGRIDCAETVVGVPLGARGEVEITAVAAFGDVNHVRAGVAIGGGFVFAAGYPNDVALALAADPVAQLEQGIRELDAQLRTAGSSLQRLVRLDVFVSDIYFAARARSILLQRLRPEPPVFNFIGADVGLARLVQLSGIAVQ
jgi:enamine deaminase RidA (YjgF/YER057c/UK114 family)